MNWFKRWVSVLLTRIRRDGPRHEVPPRNVHELRDIGLQDWKPDRKPMRDDRGERIGGKDPFSW